jgi:hypothetical protein
MSAPSDNGPCHVSGIFLPLRVNSLPLATIYEVKIPLRKWKKSLLQRNPAQMTWHMTWANVTLAKHGLACCFLKVLVYASRSQDEPRKITLSFVV